MSQRNFGIRLVFAAFVLSMGLPTMGWAGSPTFELLDKGDVEKVVRDFSSVLTHTVVSPASSPTIFGFELGLVLGMVNTPGIEELVKESGSKDKVDKMPHAALMATVSFPLGVTLEANLVPDMETEDMDTKHLSLGVKWTLTNILFSLPVDLALKGFLGTSEFSFSQVLNNSTTSGTDVNVDINFKDTITGVQLFVSKSLLVVEPYAAIGWVQADGELGLKGASGTESLFAFTTEDQFTQKSSSIQYLVGIQANLLLFKAAVEYGHLFDSDKISAKLTVGF